MHFFKSLLMTSFAMMVAIPAIATEYYQPGPSATGRVSAENWENGENRRYGLQNFEKVVRYTSSVRPTTIRKFRPPDLMRICYDTNS